MKLVVAEQAREDYLHWQANDRKLLVLRDEEHIPVQPSEVVVSSTKTTTSHATGASSLYLEGVAAATGIAGTDQPLHRPPGGRTACLGETQRRPAPPVHQLSRLRERPHHALRLPSSFG